MNNQEWKEEFLENELNLKRIGRTKLFKNSVLIISPALTANWFGIRPEQKFLIDEELNTGSRCFLLLRLIDKELFLLADYKDIKPMMDNAVPKSGHFHFSLKQSNTNSYIIKNESSENGIKVLPISEEEIKRRIKNEI